MLKSSSWCRDGLTTPTYYFCMFDVVLLLVATGCWGFASLIWLLCFSLSQVLPVVPMLAILCYKVSIGDDGCRCKSIGALFVRIGDKGMGIIER